jgi:hypothetical protein
MTTKKLFMKKLIMIAAVLIAGTISVSAQVDSAAKKVGNKTAEIASKGKSGVVDEVYKGKVGPAGQTIYIDHSSKYYYVDEKGKKVYVSKSSLKDKPKS